jgi:hypothetical protein
MCFSATSSFVSAAFLTAAGIVGMRGVAGRSERQLCAVPFLFGIQQAIEGFVWLGLEHARYAFVLHHAIQLFLIIAWIAWPMLIPLMFRRFTPPDYRRTLSAALVLVGFIAATLNAHLLMQIVPWAEVQGLHIRYFWSGEGILSGYSGFAYLLVTLLPPFLTGSRKFYVLGATHVLMFLLAWFWARPQLISVWCFFAAVSSILIVVIVYSGKKKLPAPFHA